MNLIFKQLIILSCFIAFNLQAQEPSFYFEETPVDSFYPGADWTKNLRKMKWGNLVVPENWSQPKGRKIKMAVAILETFGEKANQPPVVFIDGGPGAGGINRLGFWYNHPIRENRDLILVDVRGTGLSTPRLCPDLGSKIFEIFSKNQSVEADNREKIAAAIDCKQDLINREIDISAYHEASIAKDLHALLVTLGHEFWTVYGVSYGTQLAQTYAKLFPNELEAMVLDSPIPNIGKYYEQNTSNYLGSLRKVFAACAQDPHCNQEFPNLEDIYYATIKQLEATPITITVDKEVVNTGQFTYNAEDFKIAIQQALYQKPLIEVLPMLIYAFNEGNKSTLRALVQAFSGALSLDYGLYYCITCNDVIPLNAYQNFIKDATGQDRLKEGLAFYQSDFQVCEKWNGKRSQDTSKLVLDSSDMSAVTAPVLVLSGEFDPITPLHNGLLTKNKFQNAYWLQVPSIGHAPSLIWSGVDPVATFIQSPEVLPETDFSGNKIEFISDIELNGGIVNLANNLNKPDALFLSPLGLAILILVVFVLSYLISLFVRKWRFLGNDVYMKLLITVSSIIGVVVLFGMVFAIQTTASINPYILAFGLPNEYYPLFIMQWIFVFLVLITLVYVFFRLKDVVHLDVIGSVLFSLILVGVYFYYWSFLSF